MPHVPRLFCEAHGVAIEMKVEKIGVRVRVDRGPGGEPYYLIAADRVACPECNHAVLLIGPNQQPIREAFDPKFDERDRDVVAMLR